MRVSVYIPHFNGTGHLRRVLSGLREQTTTAAVVVVDNGSSDGSQTLVRNEFPEVTLLELGKNFGFGPALNRAIAVHPAEALILLNNDTAPQPRFVEALLDELGPGVNSVAGVLLQERSPALIDSAGVIADTTLLGIDYLHGDPAATAAAAPAPLGPTGGAALLRREAFEAVGGFDPRIFLYYEDLDLALRMGVTGACCRLAPEAQAIHAYSASLGAGSGAKYSRTGWSRGYMLRRYGVLRSPRRAARALLGEAVICSGQLATAHTTAGIRGRIAGWHAGAGLEHRDEGAATLTDLPLREVLARRRRRA